MNMSSELIQFALLLLMLQFIGCQTQIQAPSNNSASILSSNVPGCPLGQDGYFPDPSSCTFFLECRNTDEGRTSVRQQCPRLTPYFQPSSTVGFGFCSATQGTGGTTCQQQDFPQLPGNGGSSVSQNPVTLFPPFTSSQGQSSFSCPRSLICNRTSLNGLYGDPSSCSRYFLCVDYTAYQLTCPEGMQWSDILRYCDWSFRAACNLPARQNQGCDLSGGSSSLIGGSLWSRFVLPLLVAAVTLRRASLFISG